MNSNTMPKGFFLLCAGLLLADASASTVSATTSTNQDGTKTTTITVTPETGESIRDFHVRPTGTNTKVPKGQGYSFGSSTGWSSNDNAAWRSWGSGSATSDSIAAGGATFTITVPESHVSYATFKWRTTSNGSSGSPPSQGSSLVDSGTSSPNETIPFVTVALIGPSTAPLGGTVTFLADNPIPQADTLTYTIYFSRSLDPQDPSRINLADMVPDSLGFGLSTNSRAGTTAPGEGIRSATFFGDMRNHVILDVPEDTSLLGQTYYLQVDWSDGMSSSPVGVTFTSG